MGLFSRDKDKDLKDKKDPKDPKNLQNLKPDAEEGEEEGARKPADEEQLKIWRDEALRQQLSEQVSEYIDRTSTKSVEQESPSWQSGQNDARVKLPPEPEIEKEGVKAAQEPVKQKEPKEPKESKALKPEPPAEKAEDESVKFLRNKVKEYEDQFTRLQSDLEKHKSKADRDEAIEPLKEKVKDYEDQVSRLQRDLEKHKSKADEERGRLARKRDETIEILNENAQKSQELFGDLQKEFAEYKKKSHEELKKSEDKLAEKIAEDKAREEKRKKEVSPETLKAKLKEYNDQLIRLQADFVNYRKRAEKEKVEAIRFGRVTILEQMITLSDVMEKALKSSRTSTNLDSLKKGFEMMTEEFSRFLKTEGAEAMETVGCKFDPHLHEAVEQVDTEKESENNIILEELQKGYLLDGRLLMPAKVKVAKFTEKD